MRFFKREKRSKHRVTVAWQGEMTWRTLDASGALKVRIKNVSMQGMLIEIPTMMAGTQHLYVTDTKPQLLLSLVLPGEKNLQIPVSISWYKQQERIYEVGVKYNRIEEGTRQLLTEFFNTVEDLTR